MKVEDEYTDVLQNIELGIVITYREHPEMSDHDVMRMLEALIDSYFPVQNSRIGGPSDAGPRRSVLANRAVPVDFA